MKTLHLIKKGNPQGDIDLKLAFKGKIIAVKGSSNPTSLQFISQYKSKGADVMQTRDGFLVNIFPKGKDVVKIGQIEIDFVEDSEEVVENKLCTFYIDTFSKAGFEVE
jgi:NADPH-dependent 7-cyano-7-deazaguanine reductase QueF-like protein